MYDRIHCDRCHEFKEGCVDQKVTNGCYDVTEGFWSNFARPGERLICDDCMHSDPVYIDAMGPKRQTT